MTLVHLLSIPSIAAISVKPLENRKSRKTVNNHGYITAVDDDGCAASLSFTNLKKTMKYSSMA